MPPPLLLGVYRAVVVETLDPQRRGRAQVQVPVLGVGLAVWAPVLAGTPRARRPKLLVGDFVYVMFEAGDPDVPVVIGAPAAIT